MGSQNKNYCKKALRYLSSNQFKELVINERQIYFICFILVLPRLKKRPHFCNSPSFLMHVFFSSLKTLFDDEEE